MTLSRMTWPDFYLLCFAVGSLWAFATLLLGGMHMGHHGHVHSGHGHGHSHASHGHVWTSMITPTGASVFLAWFGGVGYLLTRYTGILLWLNLAISLAVGLFGAWILGSFLNFLQAREKPLDPLDYEMVGVLGQVSAHIRADGVGEVLYIREGSRRCIAARSEDHAEIERGQEVIVTRFERGIAYVRTWEAMTQ